MPYSTPQLVIFFAFVPVVLATIIALLQYRQLSRPLQYLCWLIFFSALTEGISRLLWLQAINNLFLWPLYIAVEFVLLAAMYRLVLRPPWIRRWLTLISIGFVAYILFTSGWQRGWPMNPLHRLVESICVILLALGFFYQVLREAAIIYLERTPLFWISAGLILYFSGNIFIFIFSKYMLSYSQRINHEAWAIHAILNMILYTAYSLALWIAPKK